MEFLGKLSISIFISISKQFGKLSYKKLEENRKFIEFIESIGLSKPKDNFINLYFHTLIRFTDKISNTELLPVFTNKNVLSAFEQDEKNNNDDFKRTLNDVLLTDPEVCKNPDIKKYDEIPENDIIKFREIYKELLIEIELPSQTNIRTKLEQLNESGDIGKIVLLLQNLIDKYNEHIFIKLDFKTTLGLLKNIEEILLKVNITNRQVNNIYGQIYYLQGICLFMLNDIENQKIFIKAYERNPNNSEYKEWAAISHFKLNIVNRAKEIATEIISDDSLNTKAFAVLKAIDKKTIVPYAVASEDTFKLNYAWLLNRKIENREESYNVVEDELKSKIPINDVKDLNDFYFKHLLVSFYFEKMFNKYLNRQSYHHIFNEMRDTQELLNCVASYEKLNNYYNKSKDIDSVHYFFEVNWLYKLCLFIKTPNKQSALNLYEAFQILKNKEDKFRSSVTFYSLTASNQDAVMLEFFEKYGASNKELNIAIAETIFRSNSDKSKVIRLLEEFCENLKEINQQNIHVLMICMELYKGSSKNPMELFENYLKSKEFKDEEIRFFLEIYGRFINKENIQEKKERKNN